MPDLRTDIRSLVDIDALKDALDIEQADEDDFLARLIRGVSAAVEKHCARDIAKTLHSAEKHDGDGTKTLLLVPHLLAVASITNDTTSVDSDDFVWYADTGKVELTDGTVFTEGPQKITITYTAGWEHNAIPADIEFAVMTYCLHLYNAVKKNQISILSKSAGDQSISYVRGMPRDVREMLEPYRVRRWA